MDNLRQFFDIFPDKTKFFDQLLTESVKYHGTML
jgi:hypothetical protein